MNGQPGQSLQNVLSISTAANNRYLLHFNSLHSLTQWTAGIRLAMYEHATLQEAYTGSIIAGKGKYLNGIKQIMERTRYPAEDWVRVRFGAGTPWRRCWCIISPPTEKDVAAAKKQERSLKKKSAYDRSPLDVQGNIKFYENRKITKKTKPIATITDAFSAYAIYPQNQKLIDQSTLLKVEGLITIHSEPAATTEGFVFIMPESHAMVTGFEMMLRYLIPTFDVYNLYGRPDRLIADANNQRSLMFAMPTSRRYGYLELIDVAGLIHTEGSSRWNEREWRKQMKLLTSKRMAMPVSSNERFGSMSSHRRAGSRSSLTLQGTTPINRSMSNLQGTAKPGVRFGDEPKDFHSTPSSRSGSPGPDAPIMVAKQRAESPAGNQSPARHGRSASDAIGYGRTPTKPTRLSMEIQNYNEDDPSPPAPPRHSATLPTYVSRQPSGDNSDYSDREGNEGITPPDHVNRPPVSAIAPATQPMMPVAAPPAFAHAPRAQPPVKPGMLPGLRDVTNNLDPATMAQLQDATTSHAPGNQQQQFRPQQDYRQNQSPYGANVSGPYYAQPSGPPPRNSSNPTNYSNSNQNYQNGNSNGNGYTIGQPTYPQHQQQPQRPMQPQSSREDFHLDQLDNLPGMPSMLPERIQHSTSNPSLRQKTSQDSIKYGPAPPPPQAQQQQPPYRSPQIQQQQQQHMAPATPNRRNHLAAPQTLPTIPGTPAGMERNYEGYGFESGGESGPGTNDVSRERSRESSRNRGSADVSRKPVGGAGRGGGGGGMGYRGVSPAGRY
jgi:CCR4-NOT transcriptional complex subunit CAF120